MVSRLSPQQGMVRGGEILVCTSNIRHTNFRLFFVCSPVCSCVPLGVPPLDSETGQTGELWSKTNHLNWQNQEYSFFLAKKNIFSKFSYFLQILEKKISFSDNFRCLITWFLVFFGFFLGGWEIFWRFFLDFLDCWRFLQINDNEVTIVTTKST